MSGYTNAEIITVMKGYAIIENILKKSKTPALDSAMVGDRIEFSMNIKCYRDSFNPTIKSAHPVRMHNMRTGKTSRLTPAEMNRCLQSCEWREIIEP